MLRKLFCALWLVTAGFALAPGSASGAYLGHGAASAPEAAPWVETVQYRQYYGPGAVYPPRRHYYGPGAVYPPRGRAYGRRYVAPYRGYRARRGYARRYDAPRRYYAPRGYYGRPYR